MKSILHFLKRIFLFFLKETCSFFIKLVLSLNITCCHNRKLTFLYFERKYDRSKAGKLCFIESFQPSCRTYPYPGSFKLERKAYDFFRSSICSGQYPTRSKNKGCVAQRRFSFLE